MPRRKAEGRSDLILNSALLQFAKYGFAKTTIGDIAKEAKVASGTIYLYYKSKEEILKACAVRFHEEHKNFVKELLSRELPPKAKLIEYLQNRHLMWEKETVHANFGSDLAMAMVSASPEINKAEQSLWLQTLKSILKDGENKKIYHFSNLTKELKIFLQCMVGFFPMPGVVHPYSPSRKDLLEAIGWFDQKWRAHD